MKLSLFCYAFLLSLEATASSLPKPDLSGSVSTKIIPKMIQSSSAVFSGNPGKRKHFYYRGRGTMGLLMGLVLGPVGYLCVHFCSHNKTMIEKAGQGAVIWTGVALLTAFVLAEIASRQSVGQIALQIILGILQDSN